MIDMRRPKPREDDAKMMPEAVYKAYPYGLRITLETEELRKLGLKPKSFKLDEYVTFEAKGKIVSISENEDSYSMEGTRQSVGIQIEQIDLEFEDNSEQTSMSDAIERTTKRIK